MNILPKKKWHVRTKENIARVRRDEKEAAEKEQQRLERAIAAENERRLEALRTQAAKRLESFLSVYLLLIAMEISDSASNTELELAERLNFGQGNKEYQEEKRKEQAELDSKMGIQKYFAEGTNELNKVQEWYTKIRRPLLKDEVEEKRERLKEISASESSSGETVFTQFKFHSFYGNA
ncbi:unnamed protein product [Angiostrongylus costaricensis]|uniref:Cir_N domain-containing protein n=1 Tax=Angiostrongylus costaricensis TaxID=334426 RepID=A0A0R3PDD9_ANGCS|nr:unnamed protein product [Angiostrongylus costaricensis]